MSLGNTVQTPVYPWFKFGDVMVPVSAANPLPVDASVTAETSAVATAAAPSYPEGTVQPLSMTLDGGLRISGSFSAAFAESTASVTGSISSAAVILTQADTADYYSAFIQIAGIGTSTVIAEINNNGTWVTTEVAPVGTGVGATSITSNGMYFAQTGGLGFRLRVSAYDGSATISANVLFRGFPANPLFPATQPVSGTVAATQSGTWSVRMQDGSGNALGSTGGALNINISSGSISNTSFGCTNLPAMVDTNSGNAGASTLRSVIATNNPAIATWGHGATGSAVPANGVYQGINVAGNLRGQTGVNPTGTVYAAQTDLSSVAGTVTDTNSGNKSAGTQRTILATDSVALPAWGHGATSATAPSGATQGGVLGKTALPTAVTDGQMAAAMGDKYGRQIVRGAPRDLMGRGATSSSSTSGTLINAGGTGTYRDIYRLILANSSATQVTVGISDGTITTNFVVAAGQTVGFSGPVEAAMLASSPATAWTFTVSSGVSTMYFEAEYVENK